MSEEKAREEGQPEHRSTDFIVPTEQPPPGAAPGYERGPAARDRRTRDEQDAVRRAQLRGTEDAVRRDGTGAAPGAGPRHRTGAAPDAARRRQASPAAPVGRATGRTVAVLSALALALAWALVPAVVVWVTWWCSSFQVDAAETLSYAAALTGTAVLVALVPYALRLGSRHRPRLRTPSSWLPPAGPALTAATLLFLYWLAARNTTARADRTKADSHLLREIGWSRFWDYAGSHAYRTSGMSVLVTLLLLPVLAGCIAAGYGAGRRLGRRWEDRHTGH